MRQEKFWTATDDMPWEKTQSAQIQSKLLNGLRDSVQSTMLVKSDPRPANPRRGQFHSADEEFFVRNGEFTFDGLRRFVARGYGFYPKGCIHGANVHIIGGYELLLRYEGPRTLEWVENPEMDQAYFASDAATLPPIVEIGAATLPSLASGELAISTLRERDATSNGATLVDGHFSPSLTIELLSEGWLECFVTQADRHSSEGTRIGPGSYRFAESAPNTLVIGGEGVFSMIALHSNKLMVRSRCQQFEAEST